MKQASGRSIAALFVALVTCPALADGKAMPLRAYPAPHIPQQSALIHFKDGVQYLAIETNIVGEGSEFAWVIPTPSPAEVEQVTTGVFPQLRMQMAPEIVHDMPWLWPLTFVVVVVLVIVVLIAARLYFAVLVFVVLLLFTAALLPSLGRSVPASPLGVTVHERKIVGSYDTAVISGESSEALTGWLDDNGFAVPDGVGSVIDAYIADGWSFVAMKLRRGDEGGDSPALTPHPIGLRFPVAAPVYPLRLTGVGNGELDVELFVFADTRAEAAGFEVRRCSRVNKEYDGRRGANIRHQELIRITDGAAVVTHLAGRLTEQQMTSDAAIDLVEFDAYEPTRYSHRGARVVAMNTLFGVFVIGGLVMAHRSGHERVVRKHVRYFVWTIVIGAAIGGVVYLALPKVPIATGTHLDWVRGQRPAAELARAIEDVRAAGGAQDPLTMDTARALAGDILTGKHESVLARSKWPFEFRNPFTGRIAIEEDSPGNYTFAIEEDRVVIVEYWSDGHQWSYPLDDPR